ncbi:hypothetical protein BOX15_Mlig026143g2, partial [Macrostomum lignano]
PSLQGAMPTELLLVFKRTWFRFVNPASLNRFSAKCYILACACIWSFGVFLIGPINIQRQGWGWWATAFNAAFPTVCLAQMMLNWLLIRTQQRRFVGEPLQMQGDFVLNPNDPEKVHFRKTKDNQQASKKAGSSIVPELYNAYNASQPIPMPQNNPKFKRTIAEDHKYSYLSYKPCFSCRHWRPPRTHHCPLCDICVFKRDHHCFFSGTCIGEGNERFFLVFLFYAVLAATYASVHCILYMVTNFVPRLGLAATLLPVTIAQAFTGSASWQDCILVFTGYCLGFFEPLLLGFLMEHAELISRGGLLSLEVKEKLPIKSSLKPAEALCRVFGERWWLNLLLPVHWIYPTPSEDPNWPHLRLWKDVKVTLMPVNYADLSQRIRLAA